MPTSTTAALLGLITTPPLDVYLELYYCILNYNFHERGPFAIHPIGIATLLLPSGSLFLDWVPST